MTSQHSQPQADVAQLITDNVIAHAPYTVIACDPPWKFSNNGLADSSNQRYGELTLADLKGMGTAVKLLAAPDSVLLMWAVPALVPEAIELVRAWGYDYVTMIPWFKLTSSSVDDIANTINHHMLSPILCSKPASFESPTGQHPCCAMVKRPTKPASVKNANASSSTDHSLPWCFISNKR